MALWDTAGGEKSRKVIITNDYFYCNTDGVVLVYSVDDLYTFDSLQYWAAYALQFIPTCEWALIRNK